VTQHRGTVAIGKPFSGTDAAVVDSSVRTHNDVDDECVPEPLAILNMLVDPFLIPKSQGTECVQRSDVVDENVGIGSGIESSVVLR
jgi:hypothetical protein